MRPAEDIRENLRPWRLEILRDVDVSERVVERQVVHGEPFQLGHLLLVGQGDSDQVVQVSGRGKNSELLKYK